MRYLLMIYDRESEWASKTETERHEVYRRHNELIENLKAAGKYQGGAELTPPSSATCVRTRNGKLLLTDGPYAEATEQVGGYYVVDAADLDEAVGFAARIPVSAFGAVEVRPFMRA
jgi:hypothetical protein